MSSTQTRNGQPANYNATPVTLNDGDPSALAVDANQNLKVTIAGDTITVNAGGKATAAAPTYVEGSTDPLSMDLSGNLRVLASQTGNWTITGGFSTLINPSSNFTRPNDTNAYTSGDLVANSTTAGSVVPLSWTAARVAAGNFFIRRVRVTTSSTSITNASFRVHFYTSSPTPANGDNGAWSTNVSGWVGAMDVTVNEAFTDGAMGTGVPNNGSEMGVALASGQTLYALIEARAAYTPTAQEVFTVVPEIYQS